MKVCVRRLASDPGGYFRTVYRGVMPLILVSMGLSAPGAYGQANDRAAKKPIYVGLVTTLTGPGASHGGFGRRDGALLAVRQINARGGINGRPVKLILVDDAAPTPAGTDALDVAALHKLVQPDHVAAIIGLAGPATTGAIEQVGIPVIIGTSINSATHQGNPWIFRMRPSDIYVARALATFAVGTSHLSSIAVMYDDIPIGKEEATLVRRDLMALGVTPVTEQAYPTLAHDLTAQVLALKKSDAKALIMFGSQPDDYRLLAQQMHQAGVHLFWLGGAILALAATQPGAAQFPGTNLLYGTYSSTDFAAGQSPEATALDRLVMANFHYHANFPGAYTYDGMNILARVMRKVGTNLHAIRRGILAIRGYRGAEGTYNFDSNGDGLHQQTIVRNVHGRLQVVKVLSFK